MEALFTPFIFANTAFTPMSKTGFSIRQSTVNPLSIKCLRGYGFSEIRDNALFYARFLISTSKPVR